VLRGEPLAEEAGAALRDAEDVAEGASTGWPFSVSADPNMALSTAVRCEGRSLSRTRTASKESKFGLSVRESTSGFEMGTVPSSPIRSK
jgi:hypothetical protein